MKAVAALADIRRGDKIIVDKAKFEELLAVSRQVDKMLGKLDDAETAREAAQAPARLFHISAKGRATACQLFDKDRIASEWKAFLEAVLFNLLILGYHLPG